MKLLVTDREGIERGVVVRGRYVVISIHDPERPRADIPRRAGLLAVLYLAFHDAEPSDELPLPPGVVLMTRGQADEIWRFVAKYAPQIEAIVCHCEQGASRSPAVAAALAERLGEDASRFSGRFQPNQFVYGLTSSAT